MANEMLGPILLSLHNVAFYQLLMADMRAACLADRLVEFRSLQLARWQMSV
jgi:queuine tRNA-ribosyltransferase